LSQRFDLQIIPIFPRYLSERTIPFQAIAPALRRPGLLPGIRNLARLKRFRAREKVSPRKSNVSMQLRELKSED
jgi:hypothetical protein